MNWLDYNPRMDHYYDPPDEPTHWECDKCGGVFDGGDLNHREGGYEWICDECLDEVEAGREALWQEENIGADMDDFND
jgi:hypothetical protein